MTNPNHLIHSFQHTADSEGNMWGLTKREHFASLAMQGMLVNGAQTQHAGTSLAPSTIAMLAVNQADELIKQLNENP